ncbi:hypothetical protein F5Y10DRAFT_248970 [Nemania abortiva]|nr:hypothetical protein F5Y10DRAFT_248970 [Nemania abortiva]
MPITTSFAIAVFPPLIHSVTIVISSYVSHEHGSGKPSSICLHFPCHDENCLSIQLSHYVSSHPPAPELAFLGW